MKSESRKNLVVRSITSIPIFSCVTFILFTCTDFLPLAKDVTLPTIFGNHMVLQQNSKIPVWGRATPPGKVIVQIADQKKIATVDDRGEWRIKLDKIKDQGPHELKIIAHDTTIYSDVMVGEVWLCSGQSNMAWNVYNSLNAEQEIADAQFEKIRMFTVQQSVSDTLKDDCEGEWLVCSPETVGGFSAVGYYLGRYLHQQLGVPIGLVHSSWGGTPIESWMRWETLVSDSDFVAILERYQENITDYPARLARYDSIVQAIQAKPHALPMYHEDRGNNGVRLGWAKQSFNDNDWQKINLPQYWENLPNMKIDGAIWFRKSVQIPQSWEGLDLLIGLGPIDDFDETYFNGEKIGAIGIETPNFWQFPRQYKIPAAFVHAGEAVVAVRVFDHYGNGGFGGYAQQMQLIPADRHELESINLAGEWKYQVEVALDPLAITGPGGLNLPPQPIGPGHPHTPAGLFNSMIYPLAPYTIKGAIWYQGETNAGRAYQYRKLLPAMIQDWRTLWRQPDQAFGIVQLANFQAIQAEPSESDWAELREAQLMTAQTVPNTGLAVTIDIGEADDIHPKNKQDVGKRLALWALAQCYNKPIPYSGPVYQHHEIIGNKINIYFNHTADGLIVRNGQELKGFAIAGDDRHFIWANAQIEGNTVVVWADEIAHPIAVRYAWANNPVCNLYNSEGLPAVPFRTDDWQGITAGKY